MELVYCEDLLRLFWGLPFPPESGDVQAESPGLTSLVILLISAKIWKEQSGRKCLKASWQTRGRHSAMLSATPLGTDSTHQPPHFGQLLYSQKLLRNRNREQWLKISVLFKQKTKNNCLSISAQLKTLFASKHLAYGIWNIRDTQHSLRNE